MDFGAEVSPDGKWLAYHSNISGEFQVYVRPFPNVQDGRSLVSTAGGTRAAWSRNGRELFYLDREGLLTSVAVPAALGATFTSGPPVKILNRKYYAGASLLGLDLRGYDVAPDGQRFLMIKEPESPPQLHNQSVNMVARAELGRRAERASSGALTISASAPRRAARSPANPRSTPAVH